MGAGKVKYLAVNMANKVLKVIDTKQKTEGQYRKHHTKLVRCLHSENNRSDNTDYNNQASMNKKFISHNLNDLLKLIKNTVIKI